MNGNFNQDEYRQFVVSLQKIEKGGEFKSHVNWMVRSYSFKNDRKILEPLKKEYDFSVYELLRTYRFEDIDYYASSDSIWEKVLAEKIKPGMSPMIALAGGAAIMRREVLESRFKLYIQRIKEFCVGLAKCRCVG